MATCKNMHIRTAAVQPPIYVKNHEIFLNIEFYHILVTNTVKIRNGHYQTILNKFCVFLIFEDFNEKLFEHSLYVNVPPNILKPLRYLVFKKIKLGIKLLFYAMTIEVTCFNTG